MNTQLVTPNPDTQDYAGFCLRFTQTVWGAPAQHNSAWEAWEATTYKHSVAEPLPNVGVILWFEHFGSYGEPPVYMNWGHVVSFIPGRGFLSSPVGALGTYGQSWFDTIEQVEQTFNAKYVGWSEDINGLRVAEVSSQPQPVPNSKDVPEMMMCHIPKNGQLVFLLFSENFYLEFTGQEAANAFAGQIGSASAPVSQSFFDKVKAEVAAGRK